MPVCYTCNVNTLFTDDVDTDLYRLLAARSVQIPQPPETLMWKNHTLSAAYSESTLLFVY